MSSHAIREKNGMYYLTSTIFGWVDIFSRQVYRDIILESFTYCRDNKNLRIHAYVIMSNHVHWIASTKEGADLNDVVLDLKTYTSKKLIKTIQENEKESRREWMLNLFGYA